MTCEVMARLEHARRLGYCNRRMRLWFAGKDYSWQTFITVGVPVSWLRAQQDAQAEAVADEAERKVR